MAKQSLAAEKGLVPKVLDEVKLPSIFDKPPDDVKPRAQSPFVSFIHPASKELFPKAVSKFPSVKEGDQILFGHNEVLHLQPMKYTCFTAKQYWVQGDSNGKPIAATFSEKVAAGNPKMKECVEAVILVYHDDRLIPATCQFRSTKVGAIHPAIKALKEASNPTDSVDGATPWASNSEAHKLTLAAEKPFMRFYGIVNLGNPKTSNTSGNPYTPAHVVIHPTGAPEWQVLGKHLNNKEYYSLLDEVAATYERHIAEMQTLASKSAG